ncbi:endonuclease Q family protein [Candidatus Woesearchaeota archaeon]|nr:endonuclease Q family protein [Candidatus Woesearchaeota archaeon]
MEIISDLHIHSRFSRATSKQLNLENLEKYARIKGVTLLGTGDFTHPGWIKELKENLREDGTGILRSKGDFPFVLQTEVSLIYTQGGRGRRVHLVLLAKSFDVVDQVTEYFGKLGRLDYDGRPIFNKSCFEAVESLKEIDEDIEIIPAHIWTPWFSLFGSMSGFDSVEECFKDQTRHIHAMETGLSSDPAMNWRLSQLDRYSLVSFSDLHSFWPWRIGRESTVFELRRLDYRSIIDALKSKEGLKETIEFHAEEGKYHFSGHRACDVCMSPKEALMSKDICPKCGRKITVGVAERIEELADRPEGFKPEGAVPFRNLIPLSELIAGMAGSSVNTKKVWGEYNKLVGAFGNEMNILLNVDKPELEEVIGGKIADIIIRNRSQDIPFKPGFDGVYGTPIFDGDEAGGKEEQPLRRRILQKELTSF